ncbi:MAG: BamA/TamA family outer membrane protein [Rikenellaceae bacterium]
MIKQIYVIAGYIVALAIILTPYTSTAQESDPMILDVVDNLLLEQQKRERKEHREQKNFRFSALGGPGYTPDYGFVVGGSALMTFRMAGMEPTERRSVVPFMFSLSFGGDVSLSLLLRPQLYINHDRIRLSGDFIYSNLSSNYYGVGFDRNKSVTRGENSTEYFNSMVTINPILLFRFRDSDWFFGATTHFQYDHIKSPSSGVVSDPDYIAVGGNAAGYETLNNGVGLVVNYDSRDVPSNAYSGTHFDFKLLTFGGYLGGDFNYQQLKIKYQQYVQLSSTKQGRTLAWSVTSENMFGDVPFSRMSQIGSPFDLRGYYQGQYRDKSAHIALVEYRHSFHSEGANFISKMVDRLGFVTWMGSGLLGPSPFDIEGVLPNLGVGLRFEVQPRMNFRVDVGYSPIEKQTLFYINMTEAF